ncbi:MAG: amidoligase family protein [Prevotella sp.]|nr:amidoligase family protein [Prevotella sp.]
MKTLNEQIADICHADMTDRRKSNALIKLGLSKRDVKVLLSIKAVLPGDFDFAKITFGVEVECYNFGRQQLITAAAANGLSVRSEGYNHDDNDRYFKIVSDSSLVGVNTQEVVSPILNGNNGLNSLKTLCSALASIDAKVNRSCGLHVHIGAANMSDEHYCRLVRNYQAIEKAIDSFMAVSRRASNSQWCHSLQGINFAQCTTKRQIAGAMRFDRYFKVNAVAYDRHRTIEFRQHQGTTDYEKISKWVMFLAKLVEYSFKYECPTCTTIEEIPFLSSEEKQYFINRRAALA